MPLNLYNETDCAINDLIYELNNYEFNELNKEDLIFKNLSNDQKL